jgi:hypothetical protein
MPVRLVKHLPRERPFSEVEAYYSLRVDYRNGNTVSALGLSKRWVWSREKVLRFLSRSGFEIVYPKDTRQFKKQWGYLRKRHKNRNHHKRLDTEKSNKHKERHKTLNDAEALQTEKVIRPDTTVSLSEIQDKQAPAAAAEPPLGGDGSLPIADGEELIFQDSSYSKRSKIPLYLAEEGIKSKLLKSEQSRTPKMK